MRTGEQDTVTDRSRLRMVVFKVDEELLKKVDERIKSSGYRTRSELIRELLRKWLKSDERKAMG